MRRIREAPVTVLCLVVCAALFLLTTRVHQSDAQRREALDRWGAVVDRPFTKLVNPKTISVERDLRGPIALWQGQVWRIPVCAYHHVDVWHLLVNGLSAAYLGWLLERRWGSRRMLLFLVPASIIPMIPEFLAGSYVLGFSGVIAAMFGALCVLRYRDDELQEELPEEAVHLGGAMLAFGVLFSILDLASVANLAHMTGFFYGALAGCVATGLPWGAMPARMARFGVFLLAGIGMWFVVHPEWDGTYHWYVALQAKDADRRYAELQRAVKLDPQAIGAWRHLAGEELRRGQTMAAWKTLLRGLSRNPSDPQLLAFARRAWRSVVISPGREEAAKTIREVFGDLAEAWETQFRVEPPDLAETEVPHPSAVVEADPVRRFPLNQAVDLSLPELPPSETVPRRIPPDGDAVEGRRM